VNLCEKKKYDSSGFKFYVLHLSIFVVSTLNTRLPEFVKDFCKPILIKLLDHDSVCCEIGEVEIFANRSASDFTVGLWILTTCDFLPLKMMNLTLL